ncbi:fungal Zn binuclear cluster domain-containing protein [Penicillium sp. IBT 16267x]|nr:fungal Zn binuclear cluster domain-containing protein [Penicillium sp. IBT 16267x]
MPPISSAKLRTRTGCLQCRRRRKKCDEARPQCAGCSRNRLQCVWPSDKQRKDGQTRRIRLEEGSSSNESKDGLSQVNSPIPRIGLRPPVHMPSPFQLEEHCYLYRYFGSVILPRMVRRNSLARYADQSYMLRLALEFPPLMGVLISIAGMKLASFHGKSIYCAVRSYTQTLNGLRRALTQMTDTASNDALLATVITLSVFEVRRENQLCFSTSRTLSRDRRYIADYELELSFGYHPQSITPCHGIGDSAQTTSRPMGKLSASKCSLRQNLRRVLCLPCFVDDALRPLR